MYKAISFDPVHKMKRGKLLLDCRCPGENTWLEHLRGQVRGESDIFPWLNYRAVWGETEGKGTAKLAGGQNGHVWKLKMSPFAERAITYYVTWRFLYVQRLSEKRADRADVEEDSNWGMLQRQDTYLHAAHTHTHTHTHTYIQDLRLKVTPGPSEKDVGVAWVRSIGNRFEGSTLTS